jgi:TonB family protein
MDTPEMDDAFLHQMRVRPDSRFASRLKMKLDQSSNDGESAMQSYIHAHTPMSRRSGAFLAIAGLHAAFIVAFMGAFTGRMTTVEPPPIISDVTYEPKEQPEQPVASDPEFQKFVLTVPADAPHFEFTPEAPAGTAIDLTSQLSGATTEAPSKPYVRAALGKRFPDPDSFYPASAIRQELEGKALVRVCVGPDGKLAEAPQIAQSTQSRALDEAALRLARAGSYVAGSRDGVAITDCFNFQTKFQLNRN